MTMKSLEDVRVLDLTQFLSGSHATLFLARLGAEVIWIGNPTTGDPVAYSPPFVGAKGVSYHSRTDEDMGIAYLKRTRGKKAITLNLKDPRDRKMFYGLVDRADVVVENFYIDVTKRLKIDYETLQARKTSLIYCSITGYGQRGPDEGYDAVSQAASGLMNLVGFPDGPPTKAGSALGDSIGGMFAFRAILAALCFLLGGCLARIDPQTLDLVGEARRAFDAAYFMVEVDGALIEGRVRRKYVQERLASLRQKRPTVIYAHGCSGLGAWSLRYMRLLARAGYAVLAPDSFARRYRPDTCLPSARQPIPGAPFRRVGQMRQEEIHHAAYRVRRMRWVDRNNLFLMGHSQGGSAVASYQGDEFRARVISGSICGRGVLMPPGTPALALYSKDDPWRRGRPADLCFRKAGKRGVNMEFHLFEGRAHNFSRNETARRLILDFLAKHRRAE